MPVRAIARRQACPRRRPRGAPTRRRSASRRSEHAERSAARKEKHAACIRPLRLTACASLRRITATHLARRERDQRAEKLEELVASLRQQLEDEKMNVRVCLGRLRTLHSQSRAAAKDSSEVYSAAIKMQLGALKRLCAIFGSCESSRFCR